VDIGERELMPVTVARWEGPIEGICMLGLREPTKEIVVFAWDPVVDGVGCGGLGRESEISSISGFLGRSGSVACSPLNRRV
jgi:hypothetical protein